MLNSILADIVAQDDVYGAAIIDQSGFAIEANPHGPGLEKMAANITMLLIETQRLNSQDSQTETEAVQDENHTTLTLLAERGIILLFPLANNCNLLIHTSQGTNIGKVRNHAQKLSPRISALL
ncbi:MAG: hypothetical protein HOE92_06265 [Euryarchaeota archaeon]|jgi:predicted regulator of Ras-like GTPase activity (Roadblock/LC7/MglB family)|nr:hypothetical protein [Euryarchaeota archaeon]MBT3971803.1 hypothetical protein [Euryarchaeota archaeon]MBT6645407.1 hypothetical protein [Euryarchaeota archaeon]